MLVCLRLLPGLSAAARSVIWLNVFALLVILHVIPIFAGHGTVRDGGNSAPVQLDLRWSLGIAAVWLGLSLWRAVQLIVGAIHLHGMARRAVPIGTSADLQALLRDARSAELCVSNEVARPSVFGFFRPQILVPPGLVERLSEQELQQVVLHEMEHLHRGDDWTNLLQKIGLVLFPLNPVLLWVERRLCAERELACDDRVLRSSAGRKAYALCLTHLAEYSMLQRSLSLVLGAWERRPELVRRVQRILRQPGKSMARRPAMAATAALVAGALGCTLSLAHCPQIVSFAPAAQASTRARALAPEDLNELGRELGGKPQLVKAMIPQQPMHSEPKPARVRTKVVKRPSPPQPMMAQLPAEDATLIPAQRTFVVLTEWSDTRVLARVMIRVDEYGRAQYVAVPATYAVVPTPAGWLVVQI